MKIITYSISYFLSSVCPFCPSFPYVIFYLLPWIFPPTSQAFTLRSQPKSLLLFVSSPLHPLWESVSKWIDWAKSVAWRERRGESGWGAWERQRDGHELFMNVSMKGSKTEGGGGGWGGLKRWQQRQTSPISRELHCQNHPSLLLAALPL